jgi:arylsulfatase A-like enzyme
MGHFPSGKIVMEQVRLLDLMPTILDLCNIPIPEYCQGQSLVHFIKGKGDFLPAFSESPFGFRKAIRTQTWCYIEDEEAGNQLFSRKDDPLEKINEITQNTIDLPELHHQIVSILKNNDALRQSFLKKDDSPKKRPSEETIKKLKALGYIR